MALSGFNNFVTTWVILPRSIHNLLEQGCHQLIREGAKLVETAEDILEELGPLAGATLELPSKKTGDLSPDSHSSHGETHQQALKAMAYEAVSIDDLVERTSLSASAVSSILLILELEGRINTQSGGRYIHNS